MVTVTPTLVLAAIASLLFTLALYYTYQLERVTREDTMIWFFLGLTTAFTAILAYTHLLCAGTSCLLPPQESVLYLLTGPESMETIETVLLILAAAFSFVSLYVIRWETEH